MQSVKIAFPIVLAPTSSRRLLKRSVMVCTSLNLNDLGVTATTLDDCIVSKLRERMLYSEHRRLYNLDSSMDPQMEGGMLRREVAETERLQAVHGAFLIQDEVPFFPENLPERPEIIDLESKMGPPLHAALVLDRVGADINMNAKLWALYLRGILRYLQLKTEDDGRYASALTCDTSCLQAISKRVHMGKFLAESKYQMAPDEFIEAVNANDPLLLEEALMFNLHKAATTKKYTDMAKATGDERLVLAANIYLCFVVPFAEDMEKEYIVAKLTLNHA